MRKTWKVDEYDFTMIEMIENVTRECARRPMNDEDFAEFCALQDKRIQSQDKKQKEFGMTHYFPGCYGDALTDC